MGKMSKFMKHHCYGHSRGFPMHHGFGPAFGAAMNSDSMHGHNIGFPMNHGFGPLNNEMNSESIGWHHKPWKHVKKFHKLRQIMHNMNDSNAETNCSLCVHQLKAGSDIEMLECRCLYHRVCLKELISLMAITEEEVLCTYCHVKVEPQLLESFKTRLGIQINPNSAATELENLRI